MAPEHHFFDGSKIPPPFCLVTYSVCETLSKKLIHRCTLHTLTTYLTTRPYLLARLSSLIINGRSLTNRSGGASGSMQIKYYMLAVLPADHDHCYDTTQSQLQALRNAQAALGLLASIYCLTLGKRSRKISKAQQASCPCHASRKPIPPSLIFFRFLSVASLASHSLIRFLLSFLPLPYRLSPSLIVDSSKLGGSVGFLATHYCCRAAACPAVFPSAATALLAPNSPSSLELCRELLQCPLPLARLIVGEVPF